MFDRAILPHIANHERDRIERLDTLHKLRIQCREN